MSLRCRERPRRRRSKKRAAQTCGSSIPLRQRYRRLAKKFHPDRNVDDPEAQVFQTKCLQAQMREEKLTFEFNDMNNDDI